VEQERVRHNRSLEENAEKEREVVDNKKECRKLKKERDKMSKVIDALKKRTAGVEKDQKHFEQQRVELKTKIDDEVGMSMQAKKELNVDKKKIEDLLRARDILNKNVIKADTRTRQQIDVMKRAETMRQNLEKDVKRWALDSLEWKKSIIKLEKEREKYGVELSVANSKHFAALEDLKKRETRLADLTKETADVQSKLNQQKNLYDAVCTDRNLYSKNLIESNEEIAEMKKKFKIMYHQIEQLKEEIKEKDTALIKEHFNHHKVMKYNDTIQEKLAKAKKKVQSMQSITETQQKETKKIETRIQDAQEEKASQQKEHDGVVGERDILTTQLTRRNEELTVLYEKIKIQQSNIAKGDFQYQKVLAEIAAHEAEIAKVTKEYNEMKGDTTNVMDYKKDLISLEKQLRHEEVRKQALVQELSNPLNVHRWRKVEGSDPQTFELLTKIKQLQKRLIQKLDEAVEKDMLIQEKEKLYVQLKNILSRQPGPEVSQQLEWYTENLKEKTKLMKKMKTDLREYHTQVQNYMNDIDAYHQELSAIKQNYFKSCAAQRSAHETLNDYQQRDEIQQGVSAEQDQHAAGGLTA
jgi:DNA repair exonuclease SbcCD ATPase subunit